MTTHIALQCISVLCIIGLISVIVYYYYHKDRIIESLQCKSCQCPNGECDPATGKTTCSICKFPQYIYKKNGIVTAFNSNDPKKPIPGWYKNDKGTFTYDYKCLSDKQCAYEPCSGTNIYTMLDLDTTTKQLSSNPTQKIPTCSSDYCPVSVGYTFDEDNQLCTKSESSPDLLPQHTDFNSNLLCSPVNLDLSVLSDDCPYTYSVYSTSDKGSEISKDKQYGYQLFVRK